MRRRPAPPLDVSTLAPAARAEVEQLRLQERFNVALNTRRDAFCRDHQIDMRKLRGTWADQTLAQQAVAEVAPRQVFVRFV